MVVLKEVEANPMESYTEYLKKEIELKKKERQKIYDKWEEDAKQRKRELDNFFNNPPFLSNGNGYPMPIEDDDCF